MTLLHSRQVCSNKDVGGNAAQTREAGAREHGGSKNERVKLWMQRTKGNRFPTNKPLGNLLPSAKRSCSAVMVGPPLAIYRLASTATESIESFFY